MTAVEVDRLSLRCDVGRREPVRFAIEDALRTELPDDGRLMLVRKLHVAPAGSAARPASRQTAMRDAWMAATGGSRHGGEDGAAETNCVWFASTAEAERLLLDRLLRGRAIDGWFWKMAVPRWRRRPVPEWLPELLTEAGVPAEEPRLMALVEVCLAAGADQVLVAALDRAAPFQTGGSFGASIAASPAPVDREGVQASEDRAPRLAASMVLRALAPPLRALLNRLAAEKRDHMAVRTIVRAQLLRGSPALALAPAAFKQVLVEAMRLIAGGEAPIAAAPAVRGKAAVGGERRKAQPPARGAVPRARTAPPARSRPARSSRSRRGTAAEAPAESDPPATVESPAALLRLPLHSRHAGLWLVVPALADMGLRFWLAERPHLLGEHPGAQLMLAIARHHRIAPDDPALMPFAGLDLLATTPGWAALWRHGLDRWLRRHARRRLHDLVNRPGRVSWDEARLDATYPAGDADIRLRRLALDRDPGWTDWLGLSVRYRFRGQEEL